MMSETSDTEHRFKRRKRKPEGTEMERLDRFAAAVAELNLDDPDIYRGDDEKTLAFEAPARVWRRILETGRDVGVW